MKIETPCFVYSRSSSSRLPGKNMMEVANNTPLYKGIYFRLKSVFKEVIVLTSEEKSDDEFCDELAKSNMKYFRGDLQSPLKRTYKFLKQYDCNYFYRVCGDSPLYPIDLIYKVENEVLQSGYSNLVVTNVYPTRAWPKGWSIERIPAKLIKRAIESGRPTEADHEHLTPWIYRNATRLGTSIYVIQEPRINLNDISFVIDTEEDHERMKKIPDEWFSSRYYLRNGYEKALEEIAGVEQIRLNERKQLIKNLDIVQES